MSNLLPIAILLVVIGFVIWRLPRIELGYPDGYRTRRFLNWFPLGLTYAFLYMGRYNLNAAMSNADLLSKHDYGTIFAIGAWVYGLSFLVNGPLADRIGGRTTILIGAGGSALMNVAMGFAAKAGIAKEHVALVFSVLYGANMYFQSFGAVSIIKVNSAWFHVRERGVFGGIFGILISLGLYFAFDWGGRIASTWPHNIERLFFIPAAILCVVWVASFVFVRDNPSGAGYPDFDTGDASSGDNTVASTGCVGIIADVVVVMRRMLTNPVIMTIACIEACSGFLRDSMTHWYKPFAEGVLGKEAAGAMFVSKNWGMLLCVAGIMGGSFAGIISDRVFNSRRPPVAAVLYCIMLAGALALFATLATPSIAGFVIVAMVMSVLGVHGVLSGTASADFGGKKNAGVATGIIDGFVYAGVGLQSLIIGNVLPKTPELAKDVANWRIWPLTMIPVAVVGLFLATRVWNAKPKPKEAATAPPSKAPKRAKPDAQAKILDQALEVARSAGSKGVVAFDLDSTLFDNRPRQAAILREWAKVKGSPAELARCEAHHLDGWDLRVAMVNVGVAREAAEKLYPDVKAFWRERFFTSEWCKLDVAIAGTTSYLTVLQETGAQIAYCTGRHEAMREGTVECMKRCGFPVPDGKSVHLLMKPTLEEDDDAYKKRAYEQLRSMGRVVAAFDNEPIHVNGYKTAFPDAHVVHLDTDSSGRPVPVLESIPSVLDFIRA